jgi:GntR family transcriptional regulator, transcriptional repressor for pyruvate dehydrogenase complex
VIFNHLSREVAVQANVTVPISINRSSLSEHLGQLVLELIRNENLQAGSRLPSVNALAERFSVATPTMREALRRLEAMGAIKIRHGSGIYVLDSLERALMVNPHYGQLDIQEIMDLLEARLLIEPRLAELTAQHANDEQIAVLESVLARAEQHLTGNDKALHEANASFHRAIAQFSGNQILFGIIQSLAELYSYEQLVMIELYNARSRDHDDHHRIFGAIREHNAKEARRLMQHHLDEVRIVIEGKLKGGKPSKMIKSQKSK